MKISEHANYLLNEFGRLQFDYAAFCKPDGESLRNEARNNLETYIAELEAARRWIPVSERLPDIEDGDSKDYDVVLTYPFRRDVIVATWSYDALDKTHRRRWFDCSSDEWGSDDITEYVTHWRERPIPPEVQE